MDDAAAIALSAMLEASRRMVNKVKSETSGYLVMRFQVSSLACTKVVVQTKNSLNSSILLVDHTNNQMMTSHEHLYPILGLYFQSLIFMTMPS